MVLWSWSLFIIIIVFNPTEYKLSYMGKVWALLCFLFDDNWAGSRARRPCVPQTETDSWRVLVDAFQPGWHDIISVAYIAQMHRKDGWCILVLCDLFWCYCGEFKSLVSSKNLLHHKRPPPPRPKTTTTTNKQTKSRRQFQWWGKREKKERKKFPTEVNELI